MGQDRPRHGCRRRGAHPPSTATAAAAAAATARDRRSRSSASGCSGSNLGEIPCELAAGQGRQRKRLATATAESRLQGHGHLAALLALVLSEPGHDGCRWTQCRRRGSRHAGDWTRCCCRHGRLAPGVVEAGQHISARGGARRAKAIPQRHLPPTGCARLLGVGQRHASPQRVRAEHGRQNRLGSRWGRTGPGMAAGGAAPTRHRQPLPLPPPPPLLATAGAGAVRAAAAAATSARFRASWPPGRAGRGSDSPQPQQNRASRAMGTLPHFSHWY
mmetsp:Transcript_56891/g.184903  ORF Transcript_56891/g.184903 Transcript_56891/m.184903 type:complete len:274 (+) Transcript_56891:143-964(+)